MQNGLDNFLEVIRDLTDFSVLRDEFGAFLANYGFNSFAYAGLHLPPHQLPHPLVVSTYPDEWQAHYIEANLDKIDPVLTECMKGVTPFDWSNLLNRDEVSKRQREIFHDASDVGLRFGMTVPIHGYGSEFGLVSIASNATEKEYRQVKREFIHDLHIAALYYHTAIKKSLDATAGRQETVQLTAREMECLLWAAHGKTAWETSEILGISEDTVNFHIKNAMRKFGVYNKRQAVVKAIMLALICP
jgi:DNA-binding CsgD family transcriptional regulator